jgi:LemA protein
MNWYNSAAVRNALIVIGVVSLLAISGVKYASVRNRLLTERTAVGTQWAEVASAMQRRADIIFNLANPMKDFSRDTGDVVVKIAEARATLSGSRTPRDTMAAYDRLNLAISRLLSVVQNERRLRAEVKLSHLPDDVSNTENEVNIARERYNEALQTYNAALQLFPNNIVAAMSGFTRNDAYIQTEAGAGQGAKM